MNKIEVKMQCCPPTYPNRNFVDRYVALRVILQDVQERLCYFRSILQVTNGCVMAGENFWIV